jgi:hypothetical protein
MYGKTTLPLEWSNEMAYIVGLTATDGCPYTGIRKINFKSADRALVETYRGLLGRTNRIKERVTRSGGRVYFIEFGDARLYRWLQRVGLTPRKSLTLGAIGVPDPFLAPLLRGLFEGDGNVENFTHHPTVKTYPSYTYERLRTNFNSASRAHLLWIQSRVEAVFGLSGHIQQQPRVEGRHDFFRLSYGNRASEKLLPLMYPSANVPMLERKWRIWDAYASRKGIA